MGDPAVIGPTIRNGVIETIAKQLLSSVVIGLFLLIGTASAGAVELVDDAVEVLPVDEADQTFPIDEVVEVLPLPAPEPEPATSAPATPEPDAAPEPATSPPTVPGAPAAASEAPSEGSAAPVAVVDDAVTGVDPVVADLPEHVTDPVSQAAHDPSPLPSPDSSAPPSPVPGVQSPVDPLVADETADPLRLAPTLDGVPSGLGVLQEAPVLESLPSLPEVVAGADQLVIDAAEDLVGPVGSLIAPSLSVLDTVLEPVADLVGVTVSGLADTVDSLVPILPAPGSSPPSVTPSVVTPGQEDPPPMEERRIEPVVTTEPVGSGTSSARAGIIARPAPSELVDVTLTAATVPAIISDRAPTTRSQHDTAGAVNWVRTSGQTRSILPTSTSGQVFAFVAVLALLGLVAPRLSRWLRLQPVLWRPNALALAIERPG